MCSVSISTLKEETPEALAAYGITPEALNAFETIIGTVKTTDQKQEDRKAALKTISAQLRGEEKNMDSQYATLKRKVKAEVPMENWKRFGFGDKQ
ncbi:MAG: hypothetical protein GY950_35615 [bacterium]|nr:hypothetical protein [bacterium]